MGDIGPIVVAIITSAGAVGAAIIGARKLTGRSKPDRGVTVAWKEQAELATARVELVTRERDDERSARRSDQESFTAQLKAERDARAATEGRLTDTQHDLDDCARQRDDAFSELRLVKRVGSGSRRPAP